MGIDYQKLYFVRVIKISETIVENTVVET